MNSLLGHSGPDAATRATTPGWRDPRMWVGVGIVMVSVVAGVRLVGAADDTVAVWAASTELAVGSPVGPDDVEARTVRFTDGADLARYLPADQPLPQGRYVVRGIGAGELVPAAALGDAARTGVVQVPLRVAVDGVPPEVGVGSRVDVYVSDDSEMNRPADLLLGDVEVVDAPGVSDSLGATGDRQLVVGVPDDDRHALARLIAASAAGTLTLVGRS